MDADYDIGTSFKDEIVPLGLEYYLGVIEQESDDEDGEDGDSDDDDDKGKGKGKGAKNKKDQGKAGQKPEDCKQQ